MKKYKNFKLIFKYIKNCKLKLAIYIFITIIVLLPPLISAYLWGKGLESLLLLDRASFVKYLIIWILTAIGSYAIGSYLIDRMFISIETEFIKNISIDLYKKVLCLPAIAFEEIGVGEYVNRIQNDTDCIMMTLNKLIRLLSKMIVLTIAMVICFKISYLLGLELIVFGLITWLLVHHYFPKIKSEQEKLKKESDQYTKKVTENITGIREIKALNMKNNVLKDTSVNITSLFKYSKNIRVYESKFYALSNLVYFILEFLILYTAGLFFINGQIVYAMFTLVQNYIWRVDEVVSSFSDFGVNLNKLTVSINRIEEILNNKKYKDEKFGKKEISNIKGTIEFKNVFFKYKDDEEYTLNGLSLKIKPNSKTAIVGKSGNGKSTIFNLLLRYFDSSKGSVLIDGINIQDLTEKSLRKSISIIRQSPFIFNATLFDNFKFIKEDVTLEEVRDVCSKAYLDDYIMSLPKQYDTLIGEGGVNLSGGQKQRLAIARTLLLNTKIILFDEATSALDNESQEYIMKTIDELSKNHTIVIVAHRLTTIESADVINIIDKGKLVDSGSHEYLMNNSEIYKTLYDKESSNS